MKTLLRFNYYITVYLHISTYIYSISTYLNDEMKVRRIQTAVIVLYKQNYNDKISMMIHVQ